MNVLITGFEPFGDNPINPSQLLVEEFPDQLSDSIYIQKAILPVDGKTGPSEMLNAIHTHKPDVVLAFGLAAGRAKISLERVAVNWIDYRQPDNAGVTVQDQPVIPGGPAAYFSTLPIEQLNRALQNEGIPSDISLSAGAYLCNQVFYTMMHAITSGALPIHAGFIHLPALPEQAAKTEKPIPSLSLTLMHQAVRTIISHLSMEQNSNHPITHPPHQSGA